MTYADGRTFEDTVEDGLVLFAPNEPVRMPMRLELIDDAGRVVDEDECGFVDQ